MRRMPIDTVDADSTQGASAPMRRMTQGVIGGARRDYGDRERLGRRHDASGRTLASGWERCWRAFLRDAQRVLEAPVHERKGLLSTYQTERPRTALTNGPT